MKHNIVYVGLDVDDTGRLYLLFSNFIYSDIVRPKPVAAGFWCGSPLPAWRRFIEPVNKRGRHTNSLFNSNSRKSLELECSKGEI